MFGYFRFFSIFCTIIIAVFIAVASVFAFRTIASEPESGFKSEPKSKSVGQDSFAPSYSFPRQSQQNFRYIIPAATRNQPATQTQNPTAPNPTTPSPVAPNLTTPNPPQPNIVTKNQPTAASTPLPAPVAPSAPETGTSNPFQYNTPDGNNGLVPRNISSLPTGIQVIGIMILSDQKSIAAIRMPKINTTQRNTITAQNSDVFYVREGDIIEVPTGNLTTNRTNTTTRGIINSQNEILFLVIEKITSQHVEVRSRSNIADKHILR
ncbi:MAG: hypothetical protein LBT09_10485 [Planctomycetaceae bacterium]|nr:hypothetical protein [Planctomycetaceae bacterium]